MTTLPTNTRGARRRESIVSAAAEIFLRDGYERASIDAVIECSGGSKATLYTYFDSKEALFRSALNAILPETLRYRIAGLPIRTLAALVEGAVTVAERRSNLPLIASLADALRDGGHVRTPRPQTPSRRDRAVELEKDDLTYCMGYSYAPERPATYWEPASGGVQVEYVEVILPGPVTIDVPDWDRLEVLDELVQLAYDQERERAEIAAERSVA